ncbi:MAG: ABC transporter ATP-binding protein [Fretibacterium sp.]|nr:ABC transporter ATP-binding protein [Fretibacterium sp.]
MALTTDAVRPPASGSRGSEPLLEVRDLHHSYPDGHPSLNGVFFELYPGEKLALVGPNGSGKSTLLLHLAGCLAAQKGAVLLRGRPVGNELKLLREAVGLIFQEPDDQLFMPQVLEDVAFGLVARGMGTALAHERAEAVLDALNISHLASRPPHRLSGGEKRLVALAGILAMSPEMVVLDEPSAALDPRARRRVIELLQELDTPLILATHDLDMALDVCGRAVLLYEGRVVAEGRAEKLLGDEVLLCRNGLELPLSLSTRTPSTLSSARNIEDDPASS